METFYFMRQWVNAYRFINLLSLDVVLGSVCSAYFFSRLFQTKISSVSLIVLGTTVWVIYTADHLRDAYRLSAEASTHRHRFHYYHFKKLLVCLLVASVINAILILFIDRSILKAGIVLSVAVVAYSVLVNYVPVLKEILIALLYSVGVMLPALVTTSTPVSQWPWLSMIVFFTLALINLLMFSWFDRHSDRQDDNFSLVTICGDNISQSIIWVLIILVFVLSVVAFSIGEGVVILVVMNVIFLIIFSFNTFFQKSDRYRLVGDAVFLLPIFGM